ncbi:hypothetical protein NTE_02829 [Candidatus Nitrososphaera evergladensis SR1]|jgi:hypothetical protein|uniref:Uncharacterized protein n=1 Tax=Candidatus Nitrososphaera evergladensis SR1 TaxID=1459636 RepID=A0A075N043_9ARCH|nr:hypothetical protein NTE_02829 [Candidatus Nitrososphaera evergladensis SR1]
MLEKSTLRKGSPITLKDKTVARLLAYIRFTYEGHFSLRQSTQIQQNEGSYLFQFLSGSVNQEYMSSNR